MFQTSFEQGTAEIHKEKFWAIFAIQFSNQIPRITKLKEMHTLDELNLARRVEFSCIPKEMLCVLKPTEGRLYVFNHDQYDEYRHNVLPLFFYQCSAIPDLVLDAFLQVLLVAEPGLVNNDGDMLNTCVDELKQGQIGLARDLIDDLIDRRKEPTKEMKILAQKLQDAQNANVTPETCYETTAWRYRKVMTERMEIFNVAEGYKEEKKEVID